MIFERMCSNKTEVSYCQNDIKKTKHYFIIGDAPHYSYYKILHIVVTVRQTAGFSVTPNEE